MRERAWLTTTDPEPMLRFLKDRATSRKARLLVCGAARLTWDELTDERSRRAVEVGELYADGRADDDARRTAQTAAFDVALESIRAGNRDAPLDCLGASLCVFETVESMWGLVSLRRSLRERVSDLPWRLVDWTLGVGKVSLRRPGPDVWCQLIREVFGNPFQPVGFDPQWRASNVLGLARGIYEDRAFDRLPLLADALMDAGCDHDDILKHCRHDGLHARGCSVVDMVLAKG